LNPLKNCFLHETGEAGCDEAGRGCLAGPVFAAAVILPRGFYHPLLNDSKAMSRINREQLREIICREALAWAVSSIDHAEIDRINILNASIQAMHLALDQLSVIPELILVDGNRFYAFRNIPHQTIISGDAQYTSIAAASVLAKTFRDEYMISIDKEYPMYLWSKNKGYPTAEHRNAILAHGYSPYHRMTFRLSTQLKLDL